ncbi:B12-binding domain-containing radical SAM protein [Geoalkalibacter halelectricus]|uniref:B12-binding domain-containing radical SAM protein n=1 Tax=Geoalkalibacter halelectricus TaxID=2847045 RepID=A0ABY5ZRZ6_9BACT|nr:radical SAM protein [Geoalkalibacter halelectricus]MDO3379838.1 B12-binding domain-containing radical SAM protein [Geoalkalibacter halelectricus]UWZ80630.1 B12-binding domain-containing radical SAM protein [Geoalkalibacter halelectricus]
MQILLVNPPNCGRSIPEEQYGITSLKQIFRGEPLALETLAGNLHGHDVAIADLKTDPQCLQRALEDLRPDVVGFTAVTCEANTVLRLAGQAKETCGALTVAGGSHASNDPEFFNHPAMDFVVIGLGKKSFRELVDALDSGNLQPEIPGIAKTTPHAPMFWTPRVFTQADLVEEHPPRYDLVAPHRAHYTLKSLGLELGFVASAHGCPFDCDFCCIAPITGGRYLTQSIDAVIRDIGLLGDIPVIRLVDANTFGNPEHAAKLAQAIQDAGIRKHFLADVRSDTVVQHPNLLRKWKEIGLRAVIIGFEEISDQALATMNKSNCAEMNREAVAILHEIGITIVGDYIVSPDYDERDFDQLERYLSDNPVDLPIFTVLTPLPGTPLHARMKERITIHDLDYYTLTNAVVPTRLKEKIFYERYAGLIQAGHANARL